MSRHKENNLIYLTVQTFKVESYINSLVLSRKRLLPVTHKPLLQKCTERRKKTNRLLQEEKGQVRILTRVTIDH